MNGVEEKNKWIVCDVCDTLFYSNTTFDFIRFVMLKQGGFRNLIFRLVISKNSPFYYFLELISMLVSKDYTKAVAIIFLKGFSQTALANWANVFYDEFLMPRKIQSVFSLIDRLGVGKNLILASSSLYPIVNVIAIRNSAIHFVASELEIKEGAITGRLVVDLKGKKQTALASYLTLGADNELVVITDNQSDFDLVKMAKYRFIVVSKEEEKKFWSSLAPTYILK